MGPWIKQPCPSFFLAPAKTTPCQTKAQRRQTHAVALSSAVLNSTCKSPLHLLLTFHRAAPDYRCKPCSSILYPLSLVMPTVVAAYAITQVSS